MLRSCHTGSICVGLRHVSDFSCENTDNETRAEESSTINKCCDAVDKRTSNP